MQNKKLLSVCLTVLLVCICLVGVFSLSVSAVTPVTWKVTGTANPAAGEYATLQEAMDAAAAKTDWQGTDELTIEITTATAQAFNYEENGLLFEVNTIFTQANTKLPITIKGGTLSVGNIPIGEGEGPHTLIACSNDYTFKNVTVYFGEKYVEFYAGSGEVVFEDSTVYNTNKTSYNKKARFYSDNFTSAAFDGWEQENVDAVKGEDGLIPVSLTFRRTDYPCGAAFRFATVFSEQDFAASGDLISADDLHVSFNVEDSKLGSVQIRELGADGTGALSPVKKISLNVIDTSANKTGNTEVHVISPAGNAVATQAFAAPDFDLEVNLDGGTYKGAVTVLSGVSFKGNVDVTVNGSAFTAGFTVGGSGVSNVQGNVTNKITDCTIPGKFYGTNGAATNVTNELTGCTLADEYYGAKGSAAKVINNLIGCTVKAKCYGTGAEAKEVYNTIDGTTFTSTFYGIGANAEKVENRIVSGTLKTFAGISANAQYVTNTIEGGSVNKFYAVTGNKVPVKCVTNNLNGGTVNEFYGNSAQVTEVKNTLDGAVITKSFYGTNAKVEKVENQYLSGTVKVDVYGTNNEAKEVYNTLDGAVFAKAFYGTGEKAVAEKVVNHYLSGTVTGKANGTLGAADTVENFYEGDATFGDYIYGTRGDAKLVRNHYRSIGKHDWIYGDWGSTELVQNYFYNGFVATAGKRILGSRTAGKALADGEKREIENHFYDCDFSKATFYGTDGGSVAFPTISKITNSVMGGSFMKFLAGAGRGDANEIVNVITGNAHIALFYGAGMTKFDDGIDDSYLEAVIDTAVGTETEPFTGRIDTFYGGNETCVAEDTRLIITNTVNSGTIGQFVGGSAAGIDGSVTNVIRGGNFEGIVHGGANDSTVGGTGSVAGAVELTISGGIFSGKVTSAGDAVKVSGTVGVTSKGQIIGTEGNNVTLVQYDQWLTDHKYLILPKSDLEQVVIKNNDASVNGQGYADLKVGAIVGFSVPKGGVMASLLLKEKMVVKIWFPKADIDTYLEVIGNAFDYEVTLDYDGTPVSLAKGSINAPHKADITHDGIGYYLVTLSGIGAGSFDNTFTVTSSAMTFSNTVLKLVSDGIKFYAGKDVEPLFQSIYDYGAAACGLDTCYDRLPYSTDLPASIVNKANNAVANFSDVTALMGDAIGLRFMGTAGASFDPAAVVVKLDGAVLNSGTDYRIVNEAGSVYIDVFFNAAFMSTDMTVTIEAGGVTAFNYQSSVERTVADIVRVAPRNEKAVTLLVYIQQAKAYFA